MPDTLETLYEDDAFLVQISKRNDMGIVIYKPTEFEQCFMVIETKGRIIINYGNPTIVSKKIKDIVQEKMTERIAPWPN